MSEKNNELINKYAVIEVGEKEYKLGFPTRKDAKIAEEHGLTLNNLDKAITIQDIVFYTGLLSNHPSMTPYEAERIAEQYESEDGDLEEIREFLVNQYKTFIQSPDGAKKKKMKLVKA